MNFKIITYVIVATLVITGCHKKTQREKELDIAVAMNNQENSAHPSPTQVASPTAKPKPCKPSTTGPDGIVVFSGCL